MNTEQRKAWIEEVLNWLSEIEKVAETAPAVKGRARLTASEHFSAASRPHPANGDKGLDLPVTSAKGVTANLAGKLARMGVRTIRDLVYFFPRRHLDYSQRKFIRELEIGEEQTVLATVWEARIARLGNQRGTEAFVGDETGNIRIVWFNQPYLAKRFATNAHVVISGRVTEFKKQKVFESPEWELVEDKELIHTGRMVPVYSLTRGLYPRQVRNLVKRVIDEWTWHVVDFLPQETKNRCHLLDLPSAIAQAHYPDNHQ